METKALSQLVHSILSTLLDQAEQFDRQRIPRVAVSPQQHASYFSVETGEPRREANQTLQDLERQGMVELQWVNWEKGNLLNVVKLVPGEHEQVYRLLGRAPRHSHESSLRALLSKQVPRCAWHAQFLADACDRLATRRPIAPLRLDDSTWNADLLRLVDAIGILDSPVLERTLSVRLFRDSKRAEVLRSGIVAILRKFSAEWSGSDIDPWEILSAHFVDRVPEYVLVAGSLTLNIGGAVGEVGVFQPSVALSAATLRSAAPTDCAASSIITVENLTSFNDLLATRPTDVFAVYSGGFASPTVLLLLLGIRALHNDIPIYHWGDMDGGGLRILAHLRRNVGSVTAIGMDTATFRANVQYAKALTTGDVVALKSLRLDPILADCHGLIDCLLASERKLEQEAVHAQSILQTLG